MFDITLTPLCLEASRQLTELPGLHVASAPRKAARLRAQDQLLLYMKVSGSAALTATQQQEILTKLADTYFTSPGSITTGLRAVATRLNDFLLARNLRPSKEGQLVAILGLAAIHGSTLLLAHAGSMHTFLVGKDQVQHFDDGQSGRFLGTSKGIVPRFYQSTLQSGDLLVMSVEPPTSWTDKSMAGAAQLSIENLRRRLLSQVGGELHAAAVKLQVGKGQVHWYRPSSTETPSDAGDLAQSPTVNSTPSMPVAKPPAETNGLSQTASEIPSEAAAFDSSSPTTASFEAQPPAPAADSMQSAPFHKINPVKPEGAALPSEEIHARPQPVQPAQQRVQVSAQPPSVQPPARISSEPAAVPDHTPVDAKPTQAEASVKPSAPKKQPRVKKAPSGPNPALVAAGKALSSSFKAASSVRTKTGQAVSRLGSRLFPHRNEPLVNLSPSLMLAIAILVPFVVVAVALTVYNQVGQKEKLAVSVYTAQQYAERAAQQTDIRSQRDDWTQVILWSKQAMEISDSDQAIELQRQAQTALDALDGIVRLDYQPVIPGGLGNDVNITHMVATLTDIYMLDSSQGRIFRLERDGVGYSLDPNFNCGPGRAGSQIIGPLIDLATLPVNNEYRATILGMDAAGNVVYCAPNQTGYDSQLLLPPDTGWGGIKAMTTNTSGDTLYLLDPTLNAVWYFHGDAGIYANKPRLFFDNQVPQMDDVIDLAVDQEFLYLLHSDGRMTVCEESGFDFAPTRCSDPAPFGDPRAERDPSPLKFEDARFAQLQTTSPPDPSLYILDSGYQSIYHFSLRRLNYQRQYRQDALAYYPLPNDAPTSFVVTSNRRVLLAFKNQVFYATIP